MVNYHHATGTATGGNATAILVALANDKARHGGFTLSGAKAEAGGMANSW